MALSARDLCLQPSLGLFKEYKRLMHGTYKMFRAPSSMDCINLAMELRTAHGTSIQDPNICGGFHNPKAGNWHFLQINLKFNIERSTLSSCGRAISSNLIHDNHELQLVNFMCNTDQSRL